MADTIDLHTHSTASDGSLTPSELVAAAGQAGLAAIALTDHDTTMGLSEAVQAGREAGIEVVPGCELSVDYQHGHMHLLGLWIPERPTRLNQVLQELRRDRHNRNERIVEKLRGLGIDISYQEVTEVAGGDAVGRPHLAKVLVEKGVVPSVDQAFATYLGAGGKAYVPKKKLAPQQGIQVLLDEGATVILAHPFSLDLSPRELEAELLTFISWGLHGLEAYYSEHSTKQTTTFLGLAAKLGLLVSGGSDFHGDVKPGIALGSGTGDLRIPYDLLEAMKAHRQSNNLSLE